MSKQLLRSARSFTVIVVSLLFMLVPGMAAQATVAPASGPVAGGTVVTIDGISFVQVAAGGVFTLGLTSVGTVYAWGANGEGQLGDGTTINKSKPVQVLKGAATSSTDYLTGVTSIAAGYSHSLAVTSSGVYAWGKNQFGQLGDGTSGDGVISTTPVRVKGVGGNGFLTGVTSVASGSSHSLALTSSGVYAWGKNQFGQLGDGTSGDGVIRTTPVQVLKGAATSSNDKLTGVTAIAGGEGHSLALTSSGVFAWGNNGSGQLGNASTLNSSTPVAVGGLLAGVTGVTKIAAGHNFSLAVTPMNVYAWGGNDYGQLGNGTPSSGATTSPITVSGPLVGVTSIAAGYALSVALTPSGVYTWGYNGSGQLGDGSTTDSSTPVPVSGPLVGVTSISAGGQHSLALTSSGLKMWGNNGYGQLGDGTSGTDRTTPVLGPNFQPNLVSFAGVAGTGLASSGSSWTVTTPAGAAGAAAMVGMANVFAGTTAATPATVSWDAGTFTYEAELAATGITSFPILIAGSLGALTVGAVLLLLLRRRGESEKSSTEKKN